MSHSAVGARDSLVDDPLISHGVVINEPDSECSEITKDLTEF